MIALVTATAVTVASTALAWHRFEPSGDLVRRLRAVAPHPVVASVSFDISIGFPMARSLRGHWLERTCADWIAVWGSMALDADPAMEEARRERIESRIAEEIEHKIDTWTAAPPDVVFMEPEPADTEAVLGANPRFRQILSGYTVVYEDNRARVALRADLLPAWEAATATASSPGAASD